MPILGIMASAISGNLENNSYESIATVTVGAGGSSSVSFSSIPGTYKHLQIRYMSKDDRGSQVLDDVGIRYNGDTTASNYVWHRLLGDGSSTYSQGGTPASANPMGFQAGNGTSSSSTFGAGVTDILDYANTNKNKTARNLSGVDNNGSGAVALYSGAWLSTAAITSIVLYPNNASNFLQYTKFALYGVKG